MEINFTQKKIFISLIIILLSVTNLNASTITGSQLKLLIEDWLKNQGKQANISILDELKYPKCDQSEIIINDISGNSKLIKVNCIGKNPWQFIVRNKIDKKKVSKLKKKSVDVFAFKKFKNKGSIVFEDDLIKIKKNNMISNRFVTDKSEIVGKRLNKKVKPHMAIRYSSLKDDWLIEKDAIVTIINNKSFITIKEEGVAMNDANYMEKIKVKNIKSGKIIVGYAKNKKKVILNTKQN